MDTVIFTVFQRPEYLARALASWEKVRGKEDWRFRFMVEPSDVRNEIVSLIANADLPNKVVHLNPELYGVLNNVWSGINGAFENGAEFAWVAEDDILVSDDILEYAGWARDTLEPLSHCMGACANTKRPDGENRTGVEMHTWFDPLGWGTWKNRWYEYLRDSWDHDYSSGEQSGWDWNLNLRVLPKCKMQFAFPMSSRTQHIGKDGGEHMKPEDYPLSLAPSFVEHREPVTFGLSAV